jgi:chloramphenicol-sensitive protein RarD
VTGTQGGLDKKGLVSAFAAYLAWGLVPLYWKLLQSVESLQILCCRVLFSLILVWVLLALKKNAGWPAVLRDRKKFLSLLVSSLLIGVNWGLYIWAVNSGHTVESSLGYYINPLVNVFLGLVFFRERLSPLQWLAVAFAFAGVLIASIASGVFPWISLILALTFGLYGFAKKRLEIDSLVALGSETLILAPIALAFLLFRGGQGRLDLFASVPMFALLAFAGVITTLPLLWFSTGARRLPLSTLGFVQYLSPTIQLALGVFIFREDFPPARIIAFAFVWLGLAAYTVSLIRKKKS